MRWAIMLAAAMLVAHVWGHSVWGHAKGADPTYLLLQPPGYMVTRHGGHGIYPGQALGVNTNNYSYGWFGAKPCGPWQRHYGYTNGNRQWSWRD